ncbi:type II toxin-antitoxin system RelE/ParE family toxin [Pseudomonas petrae]|uniref:Type II toxin-antitoxin system RelE/ParE family toxin n=1 Tax=Pseudomonas petrae TaxID=2912190 RepID=A0ABS9I5Z7_9PSED|nr:type II toxin-antitoxin system RelE/ParE family toxin [Pseudomonas petrae]MCF7531880.1 type II toxin-antitoxin system RelE/ParE family toxin [Pseudomonas petrae]MCF7537443.1 type II toxin-antitoxin system RelE/ParE family toxin [Pseudomonas petrae]MCF7542599.1 type II toxin-antitoxin system RelE/ParE family toxin [Pseudomonas petrae]MCF7556800.1 type II toxin-antitoxin system RelE/ParE family toxin [Pseudomonas petrae]
MIFFERSTSFNKWLTSLKDKTGQQRIIARIRSAQRGNFGDCESVGGSVFEMRVHYGPGYRIYLTRHGNAIYLLLVGGDKSTQKTDIRRAREMAERLTAREQ